MNRETIGGLTAAEVAQRRATCDACEHKNGIGLCRKCGCMVYFKAIWRDQKCPLGKW